MGKNRSSDSGIDLADHDGDKGSCNGTDDEDNDNVSTTSSSRLNANIPGDSTKKMNMNQQHLQYLPHPASKTSWSPPPPISFRSEQQQQQQHRVTHGPGGKYY
jgi:hypothetical protein